MITYKNILGSCIDYSKVATLYIKRLYMSSKKTSGFTLVELLIVIVIIGILVGLVVITYSGIQQRATNSTVVSEVKFWQKQLQNHYTSTGSYPRPNASLGLTGADLNLPPMCIGVRSDGNYCEATGGAPSVHGGGSYQGVYEDLIGQDLTNQIAQVSSVPQPKGSFINHTSISLNQGISGIRYGYALWGEAAYDTGVFLYYSQYGRNCLPNDDEVTVQFTLKVPYHAGYGYATNDTIMCRKLISNSLN